MTQKTLVRLFALVSIIALPACGALVSKQLSAPEEIVMSKLDVNKYPINKVVCDPMGGDNDPRSNAGLKAELYWLGANAAAPTNTSDLIARGTKSDRSLFFTQLNTPTRLFDMGFNNSLGQPIQDDTGNKLIERFALRFKSVLRLAPDQEEGLYEFAILSDDGSILKVRDDAGVYKTIVDNDGDHPTRMGCNASSVIQMNRDTEKLMQLDYYQGPRYHIAMMLLMRKVSSTGTRTQDSSCGFASNDDWFDPNHGSVPKPRFTDLASRGWRVLTADNYALTNEAAFNPCKDGIAPVVSNVTLGETFSDSVELTWKTDIASTSQIVVTNLATGVETVSTADNVMTLNHSVRLGGLASDTDYLVQAVSISDTYGKGLSVAIAYHTSP